MTDLRRGVTLVELVVTMAVGGSVLALVAAISVRQQRLHADLRDRTALAEQLRQASAVLPIELRGIAVDAGDLREARDTAVEFRSTIASAVVCDTIAGGVALMPAVGGDSTFAGFVSPVAPGDTAWVFAPGDSVDSWIPFSIAATTSTSGAPCAAGAPPLGSSAQTSARILLRFSPPSSKVAVGSVLRVTRLTRYSLYRGGDGLWYLGAKDWNATANRFNTIQPVSGPYASASQRGLELQYFDSVGVAQPRPVVRTRDVARIRVAVRGQTRNVMRAYSSARGRAADSAILVISLRNRR